MAERLATPRGGSLICEDTYADSMHVGCRVASRGIFLVARYAHPAWQARTRIVRAPRT